MTKKFILILVGVALTIGVLGAAGYAYARVTDSPETTTNENEDLDDHPAFPGRRGGFWLGFGSDGLLHGYVFDEFAEIFNLSDEAIAAFQKVKETIMGIKDEYRAEEVREMMKEALAAAVSEALDDEAITQDQADKILERIENPGRFDNRRFNRGGRLGDLSGEDFGIRGEGLIGKYLEEALAEALGMTVDAFQTLKKEQGFNVADYAVEQGMTVEELQEWLRDVYTNAVNAALKDDVITQDQADKIMEQIENANGRMLLFPPNRHRRPGW